MKNYEAARRTYALLVGYEELGLKPPEEKKKEEEKKPKGPGYENPIGLKYKELADKLYVDCKYKEAIELYRRLLMECPDSMYAPWAQRTIGICYAAMENYEKAVEELRKVVDKYSETEWAANALERMGVYYWQGLNKPEVAIVVFRELLQKYPESSLAPFAQYYLGLVYLRLEDYKQASFEFNKVIRQYPESRLVNDARQQLREVSIKRRKTK